MGIIVSLFSGGGNMGRNDDPDPITGLTSRDKNLIQNSWISVRQDPIKYGCQLLIMFFDKFPQYLELFPFRDVPRADLSKNKRFQAHCASILSVITSIVDGINDGELVVAYLEKVSQSHNKRNVPAQSFWNLKTTIIELFTQLMSKEAVASWDKALEVIMKVIIKDFTS